MDTIQDQLKNPTLGSQVTLHDGTTVRIIGIVTYESQEKSEETSQWGDRHESAYVSVQLDDGRVIHYFPEKEAGKLTWFITTITEADNITGFVQPYAKDFGGKGQGKRGQTFFDWNGDQYRMLDIGKQQWKAQGEGFLTEGSGESRHVLAVNTTNPGQYFMVVDSVKGPGSDTLMLGSMFDPDDLIASVEN